MCVLQPSLTMRTRKGTNDPTEDYGHPPMLQCDPERNICCTLQKGKGGKWSPNLSLLPALLSGIHAWSGRLKNIQVVTGATSTRLLQLATPSGTCQTMQGLTRRLRIHAGYWYEYETTCVCV